MNRSTDFTTTRRGIVKAAGAASLGAALMKAGLPGLVSAQTPITETLDELVIDLSGGPDNLDPALTYSTRDWSIEHSIYDALLHFDQDGNIVPLLAESFTTEDAITFDVTLRSGLTFHDSTPVTTEAIKRTVDHIVAADSQVSSLFRGITEVKLIDDLHAQIITAEPSAWLPSQIAVWLVLYPETAGDDTWWTNPVGTGPYKFESYEAGNQFTLVRNETYTWGSPKGTPIADRVIFRFVPEAATRVADLSTGAAHLIASVPSDQIAAVEAAGATALIEPILGTAFIRIATDTKPFDDPLVRQAVNYAVDVQTIATELVSSQARRLASIYPDPRGLGWDDTLEPFPYDPDKARELLAEAGLADGFDTTLQLAATDNTSVVEAIAAQLGEVGINVTIEQAELAAFNEAWPDPSAPPLRYATWRPLYDPHTLLSLVFLSSGYLSRLDSARTDELITSAAAEGDLEKRRDLYHELGRFFQEEPPAIFLWNVTSIYGVAAEAAGWQPRGDEYIVPTHE